MGRVLISACMYMYVLGPESSVCEAVICNCKVGLGLIDVC